MNYANCLLSIYLTKSIKRLQYPHSLSYQAINFIKEPFNIILAFLSNIKLALSPIKSLLTTSSSVILNKPFTLDKLLIGKIRKLIRKEASPRHVPSKILSVTDIPRTKNGKIVELAVKSIIDGNNVKNIQALANPEVLKEFKNLEELKI